MSTLEEMYADYPAQTRVVEILCEAASMVVLGSTQRHPEDIANSMAAAIEAGGAVLTVLFKRGEL